ncbi:MAG: hypothetical protein J0H92_10965 [Sphingobacteriales bacterium]|nr:hypothetical protein [Sphingobacteriales bacterium]OJW32746.1 MAG: hypothetical protein BGO54_20495 [Sphingobacteriales bacterium 46-32]
MKNTVKSSAYFAAYPLKAVEKAMRQPDLSQQSPYLQSLLTGQRKNNEELRVYPMRHPYQEPTQPLTERPRHSIRKIPRATSGLTIMNNYIPEHSHIVKKVRECGLFSI